jgi:hypothetical protein
MHGDASRFGLVEYVLQAYPSPIGRQWRRIVRSKESPSAQDLNPVIEAVKGTCGEDTIHDLIRDLTHASGIVGSPGTGRSFFLDWEQVREMANARIEIGSHGCTHRMLTRLKLDEAKEELTRSKDDIEVRIGRVVEHFAFPEGAADAALMALVREVGYRTASLCRTAPKPGRVASSVMRRLGMHEGCSQGRGRSFSEAELSLWLVRAPGVIQL